MGPIVVTLRRFAKKAFLLMQCRELHSVSAFVNQHTQNEHFAAHSSKSFTMKEGGAAAKPCGAVSVPVTKGRFPEAICHAKHPNTRNRRGSPRRSARKSSARRGCAGVREAGEAV